MREAASRRHTDHQADTLKCATGHERVHSAIVRRSAIRNQFDACIRLHVDEADARIDTQTGAVSRSTALDREELAALVDLVEGLRRGAGNLQKMIFRVAIVLNCSRDETRLVRQVGRLDLIDRYIIQLEFGAS